MNVLSMCPFNRTILCLIGILAQILACRLSIIKSCTKEYRLNSRHVFLVLGIFAIFILLLQPNQLAPVLSVVVRIFIYDYYSSNLPLILILLFKPRALIPNSGLINIYGLRDKKFPYLLSRLGCSVKRGRKACNSWI